MDDRWFPTAMGNRLILTVDVVGRPATFGTSQEKDWRLAVAASCAQAVQADQYDPRDGSFRGRGRLPYASPDPFW
jgi:hypothetical protein